MKVSPIFENRTSWSPFVSTPTFVAFISEGTARSGSQNQRAKSMETSGVMNFLCWTDELGLWANHEDKIEEWIFTITWQIRLDHPSRLKNRVNGLFRSPPGNHNELIWSRASVNGLFRSPMDARTERSCRWRQRNMLDSHSLSKHNRINYPVQPEILPETAIFREFKFNLCASNAGIRTFLQNTNHQHFFAQQRDSDGLASANDLLARRIPTHNELCQQAKWPFRTPQSATAAQQGEVHNQTVAAGRCC